MKCGQSALRPLSKQEQSGEVFLFFMATFGHPVDADIRMKKVLVITYSQSGQLEEIVTNIVRPLREEVDIDHHRLVPDPPFPFPWTDMTFWDAMPESVRMIPSGLEKLDIPTNAAYDLVILGYPVWFLSPPIPLTTFLKSAEGRILLNGRPVLTVIGARNMWVGAQEDVKQMISSAGGMLKGNIVLRDRHHNLPSVVSIIYWMMTGSKDRYLGIFPKPGVSDEDIAGAEVFGKPVLHAIREGDYDGLQEELLKINAVELQPSIVSLERRAKKIFQVWSGLILKKGGAGDPARTGRLKMFKWYLLFVIFAVSPIATIIFYLTYPFFFLSVRRKMNYFKGVGLMKDKQTA